MGCGLSKIDTELVTLCRERKELIKGSRDSWNSLALAHTEYFRFLQNVEHELRNFMGEALLVSSNSPLDTGHGHQTADEFHQSKDSSLETGDDNSDDDVLSFADYVNGGSDSSEPQSENVRSDGPVTSHQGSFSFPQSANEPVFPSDSFVFPHRNRISVCDSAYSVPDTSGFPNHESLESYNDYAYLPLNSFRPYQNETGVSYGSALNYFPSFRFNLDAHETSFGGQTNYSVTNSSLFRHEGGIENNYVMDFPLTNAMYYQMYNHVGRPPYPEISTWDYINPFSSVEDTFPNIYFQGSYGTNLDSHNISEVREREGIPDLEDELDGRIMKDTSREEYLEPNEESDECHSEKAAVKNEKGVYLDEGEEMKSTNDGSTSIENQIKDVIEKNDLVNRPSSSASESLKVESMEKIENCKEQEESNQKELEKSENHERRQSSSQTDGPVAVVASNTVVHCSRQLREVLAEIKDAFDIIMIHGKDVSEILEPYHPGVTLIKESSRASYKAASALRLRMSKRQGYRKLKMENDQTEDRENETSMTSCSLSLTLEKLYIWENKLYEEVKDEEKLRQKIDEECKKLKKLDDRSAESSKIIASQLSVRKLTLRINVAISKVQGIATRTFNIRDKELQPQLCELIQRLHKMWKFSFESHAKQVQAINEAQANVEITCMTSASSLEAIQKLKLEILKLQTAFMNWTKSYREFIVSLKNWLMKCLHQEQGEIPDASPSSSSSILSTPSVLVICNDWLDAAQKVSDLDVSETLNNLVFLLNQLKKNLHEERHHRHKVAYLSRYHEEKLRKFCMDNSMDLDHYASFFRKYDSAYNIETGNSLLDMFYGNLKPLRNEIHEENTKYEEVMKRVNEAAKEVLKDGILPVLEALTTFNSEMFSAYKQVRLPNEGITR